MESNRKLYIIKGVSGLLTLLMGLGVFLVYRYGSLSDSTLWIIIAVVGIVAFLFVSGIFFLPRTRIQRTSRILEFRTDQHTRENLETSQQREEKDFIPSKKQKSIFCNYSGIELHKSTRICSNCGQKVD
ncbi:MAG: hypothetical protein HeimAB125_05290 [Candidatus Heimdallarchaeota archaeon AB_125]|nr:MAG: hypothetical protein HeimAB125_05290 [Candidatus Heimdallarchaeota archaeon AB_125]